MRKSKIMPFMFVASVFSLSACTLPKWLSWLPFGNKESDVPTTPDAEDTSKATGGGWSGNVLTLDFTDGYWKSNVITDRISDNTTVYTYQFLGVTYQEAGCFINTYEDQKWLALKNQFVPYGQPDRDKFVEGQYAYITNSTDFDGKTISSVEVFISDKTGAANAVVAFSSTEPFNGPSNTGTVVHQCSSNKAESFTATAPSGAKYWSISATGTTGTLAKNVAVEKIVITFN